MIRPDVTFIVTVSPISYVIPCTARREKEAQGFFGFHDSAHCDACRVLPAGYEFWGENGHCQGRSSNRDQMIHFISRLAKKQWRMKDGRLMGYHFRKGSEVRYIGHEGMVIA